MDDRSTDIFGPVEENRDDSVEEEPEEEQEKEETSGFFEEEEEGEVEDDKADHDLWHPLRQQVGHDLKELYMSKVQQFLERGNPKPMPRMPLSMPYYLYGEEGYEGLRASKMDSPH